MLFSDLFIAVSLVGLPRCSDFIGHDLDQSSCCACHMSIACIHAKLKISSFSIESTYLLNLWFPSCLHLRTMCNLSFFDPFAITHVDVLRNCSPPRDWRIWMLIKLKILRQFFAHTRGDTQTDKGTVRSTRNQKKCTWQSCCSYSEWQSKDHMGLFAYRFCAHIL